MEVRGCERECVGLLYIYRITTYYNEKGGVEREMRECGGRRGAG
jgi:hypothetical protein